MRALLIVGANPFFRFERINIIYIYTYEYILFLRLSIEHSIFHGKKKLRQEVYDIIYYDNI